MTLTSVWLQILNWLNCIYSFLYMVGFYTFVHFCVLFLTYTLVIKLKILTIDSVQKSTILLLVCQLLMLALSKVLSFAVPCGEWVHFQEKQLCQFALCFCFHWGVNTSRKEFGFFFCSPALAICCMAFRFFSCL